MHIETQVSSNWSNYEEGTHRWCPKQQGSAYECHHRIRFSTNRWCDCLVHAALLLQTVCLKHSADFKLSGGLFWYGHHPKMHEMVSYRSSQAENCTDLRKMSMHFFFGSNKCKNNTTVDHKSKCTHVMSREKMIWEATRAIPNLRKTLYPIWSNSTWLNLS